MGDKSIYDDLKVRDTREKENINCAFKSKVFNHFGGDAKEYTKNLINAIKEISNRDIEVRKNCLEQKELTFHYTIQLKKVIIIVLLHLIV